jgi:hypothetical protein
VFDETIAAFEGVDAVVHTADVDTSVIDREAQRRTRGSPGANGGATRHRDDKPDGGRT